ncbi:ABC transporter ATP-binding protein [Butyrivibrio sp. YAB3001]|uniref:ABC transporter ATP-binding protein n=1 Tax=Butyrivibrio sp. YAB3001 TaxID=1520812 RepID=UPI0008F64684|nr:ABC transporter ATP-binding protein [Butyrivibrio sp. YAB3001]SFC75148.1 ABC-type multidrug transport system, ATPase and permease component [Butyrivibrio sp. YAB3001]
MIKKVYSVLDKHQRSRMFILLILIVGGAVFETIGVSAVLPLVNAVTDPTIIDENAKYRFVRDLLGVQNYRTFILIMALGLVGIYIVKNVYLVLMTNAQNHFTTNNQRRLSVRLMKCYMNQSYLFHVEHNIAELERNVNQDVESFIGVLTSILQLFSEILVCGMISLFLLITDFVTTMLMVVLLFIFLLLFAKVFRKKLRNYGEQTREYSAAKNQFFLESFGGIKEIKASSKESFFVEKYDTAFKNFALAAQGQMLLSFIPRPIMESLSIGGLLLFMSIRIALGTDVEKFIPIMSVFAVAAIRMLPSFNRISGYLSNLMFNRAAADAVCRDIKEMERLNAESQDSEEKKTITNGDIVVKNVTFAYPAHPEKKIVNNVSFTIPYNKSVALVGPSGAGKTTLADIILGVLKPDDGDVMVGDTNVVEYPKSWHEHIGYIPQAIFLTDDSIRANVAFGIPNEEIDDEKVWKALEGAQIADFVRNQEDGIYSNIGERGVKISGGQRQRIGIARALYSDPDVIVLDEATSALDNETEKAVMDAIYHLSGKKTMIIIAHRLSTISECQLIYEVKDGKVAQVKYEDICQ